MAHASPLAHDLDELLPASVDDFDALRGTRICITGGTGFVGTTLLECFAWANARLSTNIRVEILTRNPERFAAARPHLASNAAFSFIAGDLAALGGINKTFDAFIHAATPASVAFNLEQPLDMLRHLIDGTNAALQCAARSGAIPFLLTSSGAVYGDQPAGLERIEETYGGAPDPLFSSNAYHEGKRVAELLCAVAAGRGKPLPKIARMFAFIGPYLPTDTHFAAGNFLGNVLRREKLTIRGDGTAVRSYLYSVEMAAWLLAILVRGKPVRAYNVGSDRPVSIAQFARTAAAADKPALPVEILGRPDGTGGAGRRYVPSISRIRDELNVEPRVDVTGAVERTLRAMKALGLH